MSIFSADGSNMRKAVERMGYIERKPHAIKA